MHKTKIMAAVAVVLSLCSGMASAQSQHNRKEGTTKDETVIIRKEKGNGRTVLEIKDGTVYLNGEALVTIHDADAARVHKKIIIENGNGGGDEADEHRGRVFNFRDEGDEGDHDANRGPGDRPSRRRAMLGVMTDPKSERVGALVKTVQPGSAAEAAGLQDGDLITRVDGKTIKDAQQLVVEIMAQHEPGDRVTINYERDGKELNTTARLGSATPNVSMRQYRFGPEDGGNGDIPNMFFRNLPGMNEGLFDMEKPAPKLGVSAEDRADGDGVRVAGVKPGSPAAAAGLKVGDVITRFDGTAVENVANLQSLVGRSQPGTKMKLEYQRSGRMMTADVVIPKVVKKAEL